MDAETAISIFIGAILAVFSVALVGVSFLRGRGHHRQGKIPALRTWRGRT